MYFRLSFYFKKLPSNTSKPLDELTVKKSEENFFDMPFKSIHLQPRRRILSRRCMRPYRIPFQSSLETVLEQPHGLL